MELSRQKMYKKIPKSHAHDEKRMTTGRKKCFEMQYKLDKVGGVQAKLNCGIQLS